jgi:pyrroloquinoline quinone (PQQ) biosynthesis protein C
LPFYEQLIAATASERDRFLAIPILQRALRADISRDDYVAFLGQAYHHVRHTVPLLMSCGLRLPAPYAWLRTAVDRYVEEEMGHEEWILDDIAACGGDREAARNAAPLPATELMVAYAYDMIQRRNPLGFFGMVLVLEGISVTIASRVAAAIRTHLDVPGNALRYLDSHGVLDQSHIRFFEEQMNCITERDDQNTVIHCARMFYNLYGNIFRSLAELTTDTRDETYATLPTHPMDTHTESVQRRRSGPG